MANLTIRAQDIGVSPRDSNLRLFSRQAGGAGSLPIRFDAGDPNPIYAGTSSIFVTLDLEGQWTADLPASDSYDVPQEYALYNGATLLGVFSLPETGIGTLQFSQLRRTSRAPVVPATLSRTEPVSPAEGEMWFNTQTNVLSIRHGGAWVTATSVGTGGTTVIYRAQYNIAAATGQILSADSGDRARNPIQNFTGIAGQSQTVLVPNVGIRVADGGIYTAEFHLDLTIQAAEADGEWGIRLLRTNGESAQDEIIHQRVADTIHTDTFQAGATNDRHYSIDVQMPMSRFEEDDYLFCEVTWQHPQATAQTLTYDIRGGYIVVRRYEGEQGLAARGVTIAQVNDRIAAVINPHALRGNFITEADIDEVFRNDVLKSVAVEGISQSGRDITFRSNDGLSEQPVTVPGITVQDENTVIDVGAQGATQLQFHGSNVTVNRVTAGVARVTVTGGSEGRATGDTNIESADWTIRPVSNQTITAATSLTRMVNELRDFTGSGGSTNTEFTAGRGIHITAAGSYSVDLQISLQLRTTSNGEWGVSLRRTNGLTGNDEVLHQSSINSFFSPANVEERYVENVQFPLSEFSAGDYIYAEIYFVHAESSSQTLTYNISPTGTSPTVMTVRRYEGVFANSVTTAEVNSLIDSNAKVVKAFEFEEAMRTTESLGAYTLDQAVSGAAVRLRGAGITIPEVTDGGYLLFALAGGDDNRVPLDGIVTAANEFGARDASLSDANAYGVTVDGNRYWFAYEPTPLNRTFGLVMASDTVGTHNLTFSLDLPDISDYARRSVDAPWPASKLGTGTADGTKVLFGDGSWQDTPGGVTEADVSSTIRASVKDFAETGSTTLPLASDLATGDADANTVLHGDLTWREASDTEASAFTSAMRYRRDLARGAQVTIGASNAAGAIPGNPNVGAREADMYLEVTVTGNDTYKFLQTDLLDLPNVSDSDQLNDGTSIIWTGSRIGTLFRIAHDGAGQIFFSADSIDTYTVTIVADHIDLESYARRSTTDRVPAARLGSGTADATTVLHGDGTFKSAASAGLSQVEVNALINARVADPAEEGNTDRWAKTKLPEDVAYKEDRFQLTPQQDAALSIFSGTDGWVASTTITVSMDQQTVKPTASDAQGKTYVTEQIVGPRQTNAWIAVRVPTANVGEVDDNTARLRLFESSGTFATHEADEWELLATTAAYRYYIRQFADIPSGSKYRVEEHDDVELIANRIDQEEWRRIIVGHLGTHFVQQSPGVSPTSTSSNQLVASATALQFRNASGTLQSFDLDDADKMHGEFHLSLDLHMTQAHSSVSFTRNQPSPGDEDRNINLSNIVFASDLRGESDFTTGNLNGLTVFNVPVFAANTVQGRYYLLLVHDINNNAAIYRHWVGEAGVNSMTISAELRVTFTPTDAAAASTDTGGLTQSQVDARVGVLVENWAEVGDATTIPAAKLVNVPDAAATVKGVVELATNDEATTGTDTTRAVTPAGLAARTPDASETVKGLVEIATEAEATAGTDNEKAMTPLRVQGRLNSLSSPPAPVSTLPTRLTVGSRYILNAPVTFRKWTSRTVSRFGGSNPYASLTGVISIASNIPRNPTAIRNQAVISDPGGSISVLIRKNDTNVWTTYNLGPRIDNVQVVSNLSQRINVRVVQGFPISQFTVGTTWDISINRPRATFGVGNNSPWDLVLQPGDYTATSEQDVTETPGSFESWAAVNPRSSTLTDDPSRHADLIPYDHVGAPSGDIRPPPSGYYPILGRDNNRPRYRFSSPATISDPAFIAFTGGTVVGSSGNVSHASIPGFQFRLFQTDIATTSLRGRLTITPSPGNFSHIYINGERYSLTSYLVGATRYYGPSEQVVPVFLDDDRFEMYISLVVDYNSDLTYSYLPEQTIQPGDYYAANYTVLNPTPGSAAASSPSDASETVKGIIEIATSAEATTGTDNTRAMTPLRVKERVDAATPDASETVKGIIELANTSEADTGTDDTRAMTPALVKRRIDAIPSAASPADASETVKGVIEIATSAEATTGTDNTRAMTPLRVKERIDAIPAQADASATAKGIVELATNTETTTGTDATRAVTPAGLESKLPYTIVGITQTAYDALGTKDADTLYIITG